MMQHEAWYGAKLPIHFLHAFGYVVHLKVAGDHQKKLDDRSTPMGFIRYEPGSKVYMFYNPNTKCVRISRNVVFDEGRSWDWSTDADGAHTTDTESFHVEYTMVVDYHGKLEEEQEDVAKDVQVGGSPAHLVRAPTTPGTPVAASSAGSPTGVHGGSASLNPTSPPPGATMEFASPPSDDLVLDNDHDGAPLDSESWTTSWGQWKYGV
jgi:hypothetical protein